MRIRMLTSVSGANYSYGPGEEAPLIPVEEAARYVAAGLAEEIVEPKAPKPVKKGK